MIMKSIILVVLLGLCYSAKQCEVFTCGPVDHKSPADLCAQRSMDGSWTARACPEGQYCQVNDFFTPYQVLSLGIKEAYCGDEKPIMETDDFVAFEGAGYDGDYCEKDIDCYYSERNSAICKKNKCQSSTIKGDSCKAGVHHDCPRGHFCDAETERCAASLPTGSECSTHHGCEYDHLCVDIHGDSKGAICVPENSLENGVVFDLLYLEKKTEKRSVSKMLSEEKTKNPVLSLICKSRSELHLKTGFIQCRKANSNVNKDLWTVSPNEECIVETYNDPDPANFDKKNTLHFVSECGFNEDSRAWCPLMIGDVYAIELFESYMARLNELDCFRKYDNTPQEGRVCHDYYKALKNKDGDVFKSLYLSLLVSVDPETPYFLEGVNWANSANNDQCVKDTITYPYWNGFGEDMSPFDILKSS